MRETDGSVELVVSMQLSTDGFESVWTTEDGTETEPVANSQGGSTKRRNRRRDAKTKSKTNKRYVLIFQKLLCNLVRCKITFCETLIFLASLNRKF